MPHYEFDYNGSHYSFDHPEDLSEQQAVSLALAHEENFSEGVQTSSSQNITPLSAFLIGARENAGGAVGAVAGAGAGQGIGGTTGAVLGGVIGSLGGPAGTVGGAAGGEVAGQVIGGLVGGFIGSFIGQSTQKTATDMFLGPEKAQQLLTEAQAAHDKEGFAFNLGGISANLIAVRPSLKNLQGAASLAKDIIKNPSEMAELLNNPANTARINNLFNVGLGMGIQGGQEIRNAFVNPEDATATNIATRMVASAFMTEPWLAGKALAFDSKRLLAPGETILLKYGPAAKKIASDYVDNTIPLQFEFEKAAKVAEGKAIPGEPGGTPTTASEIRDLSDAFLQSSQKASFDLKKHADESVSIIKSYQELANQIAKGEAEQGIPTGARTTAEDILKTVNQYALAKHSLDPGTKRLGEDGAIMSEDKANGIIAKTQKLPYFPQVEAMATHLSEFSKAGEQLTDFLPARDLELLKQDFPNYVSLMRQGFEDAPDYIEPFFVARKGSERAPNDLLVNALHRRVMASLALRRNEYRKLLATQVLNDPESFSGVMTHWEKVDSPLGQLNYRNSLTGEIVPEAKLTQRGALTYYTNGQKNLLEAADPLVAQTLKNEGKAKIDGFLKYLQAASKLVRWTSINLNPEFALGNLPRDTQDAMVNLAAMNNSVAQGASVLKAYPEATKAVVEYVNGVKSPGSAEVERMLENGAYQGGFAGINVKSRKQLIDQARLMETSPTYRSLKGLEKLLENWNEGSELIPRVATWLRVKDRADLSMVQKIKQVNESTVNWARKGNKSSVLSAIWAFSHPSITGSVRMLKSLSNPKVAATVAASAYAINAALDAYNRNVDPEYEQKVRPWDKNNAFNIVLPSEDGKFRYWAVPVSWGLRPINFLARNAVKAVGGQAIDPAQFKDEMAQSLIDAYNPLGGGTALQALAPTLLDPVAAIAENKSWAGTRIHPEVGAGGKYPEGTPAHLAYLAPKMEKSWYGRQAVASAAELAKMGVEVNPHDIQYFEEQFTGSAGRFLNKTGQSVSSILKGQVPEINDLPFLSKFLHEKEGAEYVEYPAATKQEIAKAHEEERVIQAGQIQQADRLYEQLRKQPAEDRAAVLANTDPGIAKKVSERIQKKELNRDKYDFMLQELPVENGARARAILRASLTYPTDEDAQEFIQSLREKKVLTKKIEAQLLQMSQQ